MSKQSLLAVAPDCADRLKDPAVQKAVVALLVRRADLYWETQPRVGGAVLPCALKQKSCCSASSAASRVSADNDDETEQCRKKAGAELNALERQIWQDYFGVDPTTQRYPSSFSRRSRWLKKHVPQVMKLLNQQLFDSAIQKFL